jgi:hypothetical protein
MELRVCEPVQAVGTLLVVAEFSGLSVPALVLSLEVARASQTPSRVAVEVAAPTMTLGV